ncbi:TPA: hypothetical protein OCF81_003275 [Escherichia coli]|uniref:hypothetical protein n=1 Tax=Escherichia coli TaxID=562 RepID=UPI0003EF85F3|nr:hypothetical protein [Escherichia coli]EER8557878.1 hypothetical protein [Escherichia coli]EEU9516263.1 hypothetical protein [Escherichia coli]EEV5552422.1 hypothetical protein [Escherichia coli]EEV7643152.1 hypothetical protein [Escherichia coli]EEV8854451.1 hypothetical protein [Escherichia coli]
MKKNAAILFLALSGYVGANTLPVTTLQELYEVYATLNTCHQYGYIGNEGLTVLDKFIQGNRYQDNTGNITTLTKDNINYYHSLQDSFVLEQQIKSTGINQSGIRLQIKTFCDQMNATAGGKLGVKTHIISPDNLPASAKPVFKKPSPNNAQTIPEDHPMKWENSPVQGIPIQ